jgi:hypothetical protein
MGATARAGGGDAAGPRAGDARLSEAHAALLDAAADGLVPRDEHGPGAVEMGAARYVRRALEGELAEHLPAYRAGLDALDRAARARYGEGFATLEAAARDRLLAQLEAEQPAFFALLWDHVREGVFGDPAWGGNADRAGWRLIGYDGPRPAWSAADQRIEELA